MGPMTAAAMQHPGGEPVLRPLVYNPRNCLTPILCRPRTQNKVLGELRHCVVGSVVELTTSKNSSEVATSGSTQFLQGTGMGFGLHLLH